jgi:hypothetical protein
MKKNIADKDKPVMNIEGILTERKEVKMRGKKWNRYIVKVGSTNYTLFTENLWTGADDSMAIGDIGVFIFREKKAVSYKFDRVEQKTQIIAEQAVLNATQSGIGMIYKRVSVKTEYNLLLKIKPAGFSFGL